MPSPGLPVSSVSSASSTTVWGSPSELPGVPSRVLTLGEAMILFAAQDGLPLTMTQSCGIHVAGAESNVALYLADADIPVSWMSAVGTDPFGERMLGYLSEHGVDTSLVLMDPHHRTGVFFKNQTPGGTNVHYYRADSAASALSPASLDSLRILGLPGGVGDSTETAEVLHLSGITAALSPSCRALSQAAIEMAREAGIAVTFDVNFRPGLWKASEAGPVLQALANQSDVVLVGLDEAEELWGLATPAQVRDFLADAGEIVVKDGGHGATWMSGDKSLFVPAPVIEVVEAVGAGDAFAAGFLHARLSGEDIGGQLLRGHHFAERAMSSTADFCSIDDFNRTKSHNGGPND